MHALPGHQSVKRQERLPACKVLSMATVGDIGDVYVTYRSCGNRLNQVFARITYVGLSLGLK